MGPGDDGAVLADGTTITVDTLVEGVHFDGHALPEDVGFKTLAVSVSDLAAMGARSRITESEALLDETGLGGFAALEWTVEATAS